jgi:hypothetical protein
MTAYAHHEHREAVCHAIKDQLKELALQHCQGAISENAFIAAVLEIEAREVSPAGLTLTASHTRDDWTVFKIKMDGTNDICAAFEFLPETGEFRRSCAECAD